MKKLSDIKQWLRKGDYEMIQQLVPGSSINTIWAVMSGRRKPTGKKAIPIVEAARKIAVSRKKLLDPEPPAHRPAGQPLDPNQVQLLPLKL